MGGVFVKTYLECVPCIIKQAINTVRISGSSDKTGRKVVEEVMRRVKNIDYGLSPAANSDIAYFVFNEITGIKDPYYDLKRKYNRLALDVYPKLEKLVKSSKDRLYMAAKAAIAGNIIDFGIKIKNAVTVDLKKIIRDLPGIHLAVDDYNSFRELLKNSENVLYISDNAGEIVFDKIFIKEMVRLGKNVVLTVKSGPIINDATMKDAVEVNFDGLARVIETVNNNIGINLDSSSSFFLKEFKKADIIIAKGQGNFETLDNVNANIFFLLRAKCGSIASELGVGYMDIVFTEGRTRAGRKNQ
jgi:uncharacterized protein with ATP-grasp and redox domains